MVKEVRQGLRAKAFAIFFGLLLTACFAAALVAWANTREASADGPDFLTAYLIGLGAIGFFVVPYNAFRSLSREREEETWVLLVLTGLGARQVVRGKFLSALSQAVLYASACAPFVVFSYYLNGVTVLQIVVALALAFGWAVLLTCIALALAAQPAGKAGRTASHFFTIGLLAGASLLAFVLTAAFAHEGNRTLTEPSFHVFILGTLTLTLGGGAVVLEGAAASLALDTEAASKGPRVGLVMLLAALWVVGCAGCVIASPSDEGLMLGSIATSLLLVTAGFFAISERDGYAPASRHQGWARPGAVRSVAVVFGLLVASTVVWGVLQGVFSTSSSWGGRRVLGLYTAPAYPLLYLSLGVLAGRLTPLARLGEPVATRVGFLVLVTLGTVVPPIFSLLDHGRPDDKTLNLFNPFFGLLNFIDRYYSSGGAEAAAVLWVCTIGAVIFALGVLSARDEERH